MKDALRVLDDQLDCWCALHLLN